MKVLFLSERLPWPLEDGGNIRTYHMLKAMSQEHHVTLVAHRRPNAKNAFDCEALDECCSKRLVERPRLSSNVLGTVLHPSSWSRSIFVSKNWSSPILNLALKELEKNTYDLVYCNHLDTACYLPILNWRKSVFDSHNCLTAMAKERGEGNRPVHLAYRLEAKRLAKIEANSVRLASLTLACSHRDQTKFLELAGSGNLQVVPNGVDCTAFPSEGPRRSNLPPWLVFIGAMDYLPNVEGIEWFCRDVFPSIRTSFPRIELKVVGRDPTKRVTKLMNQSGVGIIGRVDDVRPWLWNASAVVVPLMHGGGTRLKILEAMAAGRAVISTSKGAEGIDYQDGHDIIIADSPDQFCSAISAVLNNQEYRVAIGKNATRLASKYDWQRIGKRLLKSVGKLSSS